MNKIVPKTLHVAIQNVFGWVYCTFCKCCFSLTHCRVNFYSFSDAKFLELSSNFCSLIYPIFFGLFFLVIIYENFLTVSFESFVFIPFAPTVLSNKSWWTSKYFKPLLSFANFSTYSRCIHQISSLNLAKALISLNLRVACVNLVHEVFECKNSLTFDGESFAAFCQFAQRTICCKSLRVKSLQLLSFRYWKGSELLFFTLGMTVDQNVGSDAGCVK